MLHEEVDLKWDEMETWVQDLQLLERLRADLVFGVSITQVKYTQWNLESPHMKNIEGVGI
jgi:hypothetical protein